MNPSTRTSRILSVFCAINVVMLLIALGCFAARENRNDPEPELVRVPELPSARDGGTSERAPTAEIYHELGTMLLQQGEYAEASEALSRAIQLDPGHHASRHGLALAYSKSGDLDRAIHTYEQLIALLQDERRDVAPLYEEFPRAHEVIAKLELASLFRKIGIDSVPLENPEGLR